MALARDLISLALRISGVTGLGQVASAVDLSDGLLTLNMMVSQWLRKRWLELHLLDVAIPLTGAQSYTVGLGGAVNIPRPDRIESAYLRLLGGNTPIDQPIEILDDREDYNLIWAKSLQGYPSAVFYDTGYPLATLYPVPIGNSRYELHISVKDGLSTFATLDSDSNLPAEYDAALTYNLAARIRPAYQLGPDATITALAMDALNVIRKSNAQLPHLQMPSGLPGMRGGGGAWWAGLGGGNGGTSPGNPSNGFQIGISLLNGSSVAL